MKLVEKNSNLAFYNKLNDKSIDLIERLKLAKNSWDSKDQCSFSKNQLIIDWISDLIINKKTNLLNESDQIIVWERLNYFLENSPTEANPINNGQAFANLIIDSINSSNESLKKSVNICCAKLFSTKFSHYFTRNFDQMVKILNYYVTDLLEKITSSSNQVEEYFERVNLILSKFLHCLKTQQNINRLFNRICSQVMFNLLNLMHHIDDLDKQAFGKTTDLCWKIIKYGILSKSHSNIYMEFFKNLPSSFSEKSNYQVAVLFQTLQSESVKSRENMKIIGNFIGQITKEFYSIIINIDYKLKISIIQFVINLIWNLGESGEISEKMELDEEIGQTNDFVDLKLTAVASLIKLIDEINLFNPLEDQNNGNMFKDWSKNFISQVLKMENNLTKLLIEYLKIDHLILEDELDTVLANLKDEKSLSEFLNFYIDSNIKYRQLSRATFRLIDSLKNNKDLNFPIEFYNHYSECLENYLVDNQTIWNIWKDLIKLLIESQNNVKIELLKFVDCILSRINLCSPSVPSHIKNNSLQLLKDTKEFLEQFLINSNGLNEEIVYFLELYYKCGLLYILMYRFSFETINGAIPAAESCASSVENLSKFFDFINLKFNLDDKIQQEIKSYGGQKQNLNYLYQLNKLQILNVYKMNMTEVVDSDLEKLKKTLLNSFFDLSNTKFNEKSWNLVNKFNIEKKIKDESTYSLIHSKTIILDNIYLIIPLFCNQNDILEQLFSNVIKLMFNFDKENLKNRLKIDNINLNTLFNDESLIEPLYNSLINVLSEMNLDSDNDDGLKNEIFESKKFDNFDLNQNQQELILTLSEYFPLEYLKPNYALIYYLLVDKIRIKNEDLERKCLTIYNRLMLTNLVQIIPIQKLESWINDLLCTFENIEITENFTETFDKLFKKCIIQMLKEQNTDSLNRFVSSLFKKLKENPKKELCDVINFVLLQTLEKICRSQELNVASNELYDKSLNELCEKLFDHFVKDNECYSERELFYICSILMRHIVSPRFKNDKNKEKKLEYFKNIYSLCEQQSKKYLKCFKNLSTESKLKITSYYTEFLQALIFNSKKLVSFYEIEVDRVKLAKQFFSIYLNYDKSFVEIVLFNEEKIDEYLIKTFIQSLNSFDSNDFKEILQFFETEIQDNFISLNDNNKIILKISEVIRFAANELELNEELKQDFAEFLQKFLIQTPPIFFNLILNNQTNYLLSLLESQCGIIASKYFLLPSHLVISTMQLYACLSYEKLALCDYVKFQELACKSINVILTRYSKKFSKLADIICNLLMKFICTTTSFSNQNILKNEDINLAVKAAQDLERVITQLLAFKKDFSKIAPYMISEYVYKANTIPIHLSIKNILTNAIFNLISLCDMHAISQLHVVLANGPKELFKNIYQEYEKYFKYTGKV